MVFKKYIVTLFVSFICVVASGQKRMSVEELIGRLMEQNYSLKISGKRVEQAKNNANGSPFLPTISASARQSQNTTGGSVYTLGAGATVNWRLFDGLGMFAKYNKQNKLLDVANLNEISDVEELVREVMNQYYLIVSLNSRVKVARESMELSKRRYEETLLRYSIEALSGLEMKLAKTDLNTDSTTLLRQIEALDVAYINLNRIVNLDYQERGYINDTVVVHDIQNRAELEKSILERNTQILLADKGVEVSTLNLKISKSVQYPTLDFAFGYNYNAVNERPATTFKNTNGFNWGFTIGVDIFKGTSVRNDIKNAKLEQKISALTKDDITSSVIASFNNQYTNYINNLRLIDFEKENADAMKLNLEVALERYRLGELSGIDFRNIQQQYLSAVDRHLNALYLAKMSEISLLTLAGLIVSPEV